MQTCFISAAQGINVTEIKKLLQEKGFQAILPSEFVEYGRTIFEKISDLIKSADLFIAIFEKDHPNLNTYVEVGIAIAYKKEIIIIAHPDICIPSDLSGLLQVSSEFDKIEGIRFTLEQLLAAPKTRRRQTGKLLSPGKSLGAKADIFLNMLHSIGENISYNDIELIVSDILKDSGISFVKQPLDSHGGADFAIWSENLNTIVGNPILIEVKRSLKTEEAAQRSAKITLNYLSKTNSRFALILYLKGLSSDAAQKAAGGYQILLLQIPELIGALRSESFEDYIRNRRNILAHGGPL